jgi:hypothetical protein
MNNKIEYIDFVVIGMLFLLCISKTWIFIFVYMIIYFWFCYLVIYYVLSLVKHQDKYYFNYIWNLNLLLYD